MLGKSVWLAHQFCMISDSYGEDYDPYGDGGGNEGWSGWKFQPIGKKDDVNFELTKTKYKNYGVKRFGCMYHRF